MSPLLTVDRWYTAKANDTQTKTRAIFVLASQKPPYAVYGNPFYDHAGFLNVFSVDSTGALSENIQNAELDENSAIHGMVFDAEENFLYSADMWANKTWCHKRVCLALLRPSQASTRLADICSILRILRPAILHWWAVWMLQHQATIRDGWKFPLQEHTSTSSWKPVIVSAFTPSTRRHTCQSTPTLPTP